MTAAGGQTNMRESKRSPSEKLSSSCTVNHQHHSMQIRRGSQTDRAATGLCVPVNTEEAGPKLLRLLAKRINLRLV